MGIFSRLTDIVNSNLNVLLDRAEDPQKMIRLIIQEMEDTLVEVRSSSARVLADRKTAERKTKGLQDEVYGWEQKAKLALSKNREDLAKAALLEKKSVEQDLETVAEELKTLDLHIAQLQDEVGQLQKKLSDAKAKQKAMVMRSQTVEARLKVKTQMNRDTLDKAYHKFENFERRMDNLEGKLDSMDLGNDTPNSLAAEIDALAKDDDINTELERLKAEMDKLRKV